MSERLILLRLGAINWYRAISLECSVKKKKKIIIIMIMIMIMITIITVTI